MSVELPYSIDVYVVLLADYNHAWWPAVALSGVLAAVAIVFTAVQADRRPWLVPFAMAYLALACVFVGAVHELHMMAQLNFMAPIYGAVWITQGLFLLCVLLFGKNGDGATLRLRWAGLSIAAFGLLVYPLLLLMLGQDWRALPLVGTSPNPTAVFTAGMLLALYRRPSLLLFLIPLAWAGMAGFSAYLLRHPVDYAVTAALLAACVLAVRARYP